MKLLPPSVKEYLHRHLKDTDSKEHQLLYLFLEITRECNLACRHCGSDCSTRKKYSSLTTASWIKILENIAESFFPKPFIVLTGGEPVLHADFASIITTLKRLQFKWGLVSNGYSVDDRQIEIFLENGIQSITISLDGTENTHNWLRGRPDSFRRALSAINSVASSEIVEKDVVTCVNPRNLSELNDIAQLLMENDIPAWRLFRIFPAGRAKNNDELLLTAPETRKMIDWISENKSRLAKKGFGLNFSCEGWLPIAIDTKLRDQPFFCRAGINIASILCDGTITGCSNNSHLFYDGNIITDNFAYTWQNGFQKFRKKDWLDTSACAHCRYLKGCQGSSIHLWRDNLTKPEFCYMDCFES